MRQRQCCCLRPGRNVKNRLITVKLKRLGHNIAAQVKKAARPKTITRRDGVEGPLYELFALCFILRHGPVHIGQY